MGLENTLFVAWRTGDTAAGQQLLGHLRVRLQGYFRRKLPHRADDLTHEVLIACVEGRHRFRGDANYLTYVYTIARRCLAKELVRQGREAALDDGCPDPCILHVGEARLASAVAALRPTYREAIRLYFLEGASGSEVARRLGVSEGTIRSRVRRALGELREALGVAEMRRLPRRQRRPEMVLGMRRHNSLPSRHEPAAMSTRI